MTNSPKKTAIELKELLFYYHPSAWQLKLAFLQLNTGQHLFVRGASGSGKTTLLNLLSGITQPVSGELWVNGQPLHRLSSYKRDKLRASQIGVVFQQLNLIPYLSVLDNTLLASHFASQDKTLALARAKMLLAKLGVNETFWARPASSLSVGQQQRVAIARALVPAPTLLIADEPTSALDSDNRDAFMQVLLAEATAAECTVVFVSHDKSLRHYFSYTLDMQQLSQGVQPC